MCRAAVRFDQAIQVLHGSPKSLQVPPRAPTVLSQRPWRQFQHAIGLCEVDDTDGNARPGAFGHFSNMVQNAQIVHDPSPGDLPSIHREPQGIANEEAGHVQAVPWWNDLLHGATLLLPHESRVRRTDDTSKHPKPSPLLQELPGEVQHAEMQLVNRVVRSARDQQNPRRRLRLRLPLNTRRTILGRSCRACLQRRHFHRSLWTWAS
eukprot:scaffold2114_cov253-Pinguiococcus_pyrenoidosus.AAC.21